MRLLAPIRLSRLADNSTSPATQRATITEYADEHGHEIIWCDVDDLDVSGKVPIRERPGFGPALAHPETFDGVCGHEMDRISRDMLDYLMFARDMTALGKVVIDVSDGTDTSTARGRQILEDRILAAQRERERMSDRRKKAARRISDAGQWGGGRISFGYQPACRCHGERRCPEPEHTTSWNLVLHEVNASVVRGMVRDALDGVSLRAIAAQLNVAGIRTAIGKEWQDTSVRRILISPALLGHVVQMKGKVVTVRRGRDGQPVLFTDQPLVTPDEFLRLKAALKSRGRGRGEAQAGHLLYRVLYCRACSRPDDDHRIPKDAPGDADAPMYGHGRVKHPEKGSYYSCRRCGESVRLGDIEAYVERRVLTEHGDGALLVKHVTAGDDHAAAIARLEVQAERRRELLVDDPDDTALASSLARLEAKLAEMKTTPHEPDRVDWVPDKNGTTVRQHWERLDTQGRGRFLRAQGIVFYLDKRGTSERLGWARRDSAVWDWLRTAPPGS